MDQICANTPAPIKANLMTELLNVQMSCENGGCTQGARASTATLLTQVVQNNASTCGGKS